MENSSTQRRLAPASVDRLSRLPPELVNKILKHVPIRDIVQATVLSRFWRYRWTLIEDLVFDAGFIPSLRLYYTLTKHVDFINLVLLLHNGNVSRFEINFSLDRYYPDVDRWLHLLARKSVKELILEFHTIPRQKISSSLFSCSNLRKLKLRGCILFMPSSTKGLPSLADLELIGVSFPDETIAGLIANSPLRRLVLISCNGFNHINIYTLDLQEFYIRGPCESVIFGNTPNLLYACMHFQSSAGQIQVPKHNGRELNFKDVLGGLVNAGELLFNNDFIKVLVRCMVPGKLHIEFPYLRFITMGVHLDHAKEITTAVKLLKSSPQLLTMTINNCSMENLTSLEESVALQRQLQQGGCTFRTLETVTLSRFKGRTNEMSFLGYILSNAEVLQTVTIQWDDFYVPKSDGKLLISEKIRQLERASPTAEIVIINKEMPSWYRY